MQRTTHQDVACGHRLHLLASKTSLVGILLERNREFSLFLFLPDIDHSWREGGGREGGMWSSDKLEEEEGKEFNEGLVRLARRRAESEECAVLINAALRAADVHSFNFLVFL